MSRSVELGPRLMRMAARAISGASPIAARTWLAPTLPDEHAAPALTAMPSRSRAMTSVSALAPGSPKLVVLGRRSASPAMTTAAGVMLANPCLQPVAQGTNLVDLGKIAPRRRGGRAEAGNGRDILGPCAPPALLAAAGDEGGQAGAVANDKRTHALRSAELVGGQRKIVDTERAHIDGHAAGGLHRIAVHGEAVLLCPAQPVAATGCSTPVSLLAICSDTSARPLRQRPRCSRAPVERTTPSRPTGTSMSCAPEPRAGASTESCSMPDRRIASQPRGQHRIVGLRAAAGEDDLGRLGADQRRHLLARVLDETAGPPALGMRRRRIAGNVESRDHGCPRLATQRRRRVPIEICARSAHSPLAPTGCWPMGCWLNSGRLVRAACFSAGMPSSTSCSVTFSRNEAI